ncbi:hypothetical protein [Streptomyces albidochromogenes]|uniref:Uncharacterized protein n=1 Tax=Streptomyces albidochromogenes TaxID=329524 RepID=A0ABW6FHA3_9ACTN
MRLEELVTPGTVTLDQEALHAALGEPEAPFSGVPAHQRPEAIKIIFDEAPEPGPQQPEEPQEPQEPQEPEQP